MTIAEHTMVPTLACLNTAPPDLLPRVIGAMDVAVTVWQLDQPPDPASLRLIAYNPATVKATRISWAEIVGQRMTEVFPILAGTAIPQTYAELAQNGGVVEFPDQRFAASQGDELLFAVRAVGLPNLCVLVTFTNVTAERLLMQDVQRFFVNLPSLMCVAGTDGYFRRINPAFVAALGYTEAQLLTTPLLDIIHPQDRELLKNELAKLAAGATSLHLEVRCCTCDGEYRALRWSAVPYGDQFYAAAHDVTELREVEAQLRVTATDLASSVAEARSLADTRAQLLAQLENKLTVIQQQQLAIGRVEKLAAIGQLAASVGHELRNPLAAVRNATAYLARRVLDSKWAASLTSDPKIALLFGIIERELNISGKIINDLLDYARERELVLQPCSLLSLVEEALSLISTGSVRVHNTIKDELPLLYIDREQFRQVLVNLIQNAIDAIPAGRSGEVVISAHGGDKLPLQITIQDNGCGIPAEQVERIFEPLYTTKVKGTGLGLAIVQSIMKRHAGQVQVHSQPDLGTRFILILPCPGPTGMPSSRPSSRQVMRLL